MINNRHHSKRFHCKTCGEYHYSPKQVTNCRNHANKKQKELSNNQLNIQNNEQKIKHSQSQKKIINCEYTKMETRNCRFVGQKVTIQELKQQLKSITHQQQWDFVSAQAQLWMEKIVQNQKQQKEKIDKLAHNYIKIIKNGDEGVKEHLKFRRQLLRVAKQQELDRLQYQRELIKYEKQQLKYERDQMRLHSRHVYACRKRYKNYNPISQRQLRFRWSLSIRQDFRIFFLVNKQVRQKHKLEGLSYNMLRHLEILDMDQYPKVKPNETKKTYLLREEEMQERIQQIKDNQKWYKKYLNNKEKQTQKLRQTKLKLEKKHKFLDFSQRQMELQDEIKEHCWELSIFDHSDQYYQSTENEIEEEKQPIIQQQEQIDEQQMERDWNRSDYPGVIFSSLLPKKNTQTPIHLNKISESTFDRALQLSRQRQKQKEHQKTLISAQSRQKFVLQEKKLYDIDWKLILQERQLKNSQIRGRTLYGIRKIKFVPQNGRKFHWIKGFVQPFENSIQKLHEPQFSQLYFNNGRQRKIQGRITYMQLDKQLCCQTPPRKPKKIIKMNEKDEKDQDSSHQSFQTINYQESIRQFQVSISQFMQNSFKEVQEQQILLINSTSNNKFDNLNIEVKPYQNNEVEKSQNNPVSLRNRKLCTYQTEDFFFVKTKPLCDQCASQLIQVECLNHYRFRCTKGHQIHHQCLKFECFQQYHPVIQSQSRKEVTANFRTISLLKKPNNFSQFIQKKDYLKFYKYSTSVPFMIKTKFPFLDHQSSRKILQNRKNQEYLPLKIADCQDETKGKGVFAIHNIQQNTLICSYLGQITTNQDCQSSYDSLYTLGYLQNIKSVKEIVINPERKKNVARFINSSDTPSEANCKPSMALMEGTGGRNSSFVLYIYSIKPIKIGTQLKYFYGYNYWQNESKENSQDKINNTPKRRKIFGNKQDEQGTYKKRH